MRITSKGQEVVVRDGVGGGVGVAAIGPTGRGRRAVEALLGKGDVGLSTDEIMAMTRGG